MVERTNQLLCERLCVLIHCRDNVKQHNGAFGCTVYFNNFLADVDKDFNRSLYYGSKRDNSKLRKKQLYCVTTGKDNNNKNTAKQNLVFTSTMSQNVSSESWPAGSISCRASCRSDYNMHRHSHTHTHTNTTPHEYTHTYRRRYTHSIEQREQRTTSVSARCISTATQSGHIRAATEP